MPCSRVRLLPIQQWMRTSLLNLDRPQERFAAATLGTQAEEHARVSEKPRVAPKPAAPPAAPAAPAPQAAQSAPSEDGAFEFELVFGSRQIASTGLILLVALAVFCGVSYVIGRAAGSKAVAASAAAEASVPVKPPPSKPVAPDAPVAASPVPAAVGDSGPLFADAVAGQVYMQVGAVDRGVAGIWAEGLRAHGLKAFVSPGPSDKIWRVLVGPLPDPQSYQRAKDVMDGLGIQTFGKRYADSPAPAQPAPVAQP